MYIVFVQNDRWFEQIQFLSGFDLAICYTHSRSFATEIIRSLNNEDLFVIFSRVKFMQLTQNEVEILASPNVKRICILTSNETEMREFLDESPMFQDIAHKTSLTSKLLDVVKKMIPLTQQPRR